MGTYTVAKAIEALRKDGLRVQRGYPGTLMPQLVGAVVAVNAHKMEPTRSTILGEACAPMSMGLYACEDLAAAVAKVWTADGGVCTFGDHRFDGKSGLYIMKVYGVWNDDTE